MRRHCGWIGRMDERLLIAPGVEEVAQAVETAGEEIPEDLEPEQHPYEPRSVAGVVVLMVVRGVWRANPFRVVAVDVTGFVVPSSEIEILQRHQVVAANLVFRGHLVKLCGKKTGEVA